MHQRRSNRDGRRKSALCLAIAVPMLSLSALTWVAFGQDGGAPRDPYARPVAPPKSSAGKQLTKAVAERFPPVSVSEPTEQNARAERQPQVAKSVAQRATYSPVDQRASHSPVVKAVAPLVTAAPQTSRRTIAQQPTPTTSKKPTTAVEKSTREERLRGILQRLAPKPVTKRNQTAKPTKKTPAAAQLVEQAKPSTASQPERPLVTDPWPMLITKPSAHRGGVNTWWDELNDVRQREGGAARAPSVKAKLAQRTTPQASQLASGPKTTAAAPSQPETIGGSREARKNWQAQVRRLEQLADASQSRAKTKSERKTKTQDANASSTTSGPSTSRSQGLDARMRKLAELVAESKKTGKAPARTAQAQAPRQGRATTPQTKPRVELQQIANAPKRPSPVGQRPTPQQRRSTAQARPAPSAPVASRTPTPTTDRPSARPTRNSVAKAKPTADTKRRSAPQVASPSFPSRVVAAAPSSKPELAKAKAAAQDASKPKAPASTKPPKTKLQLASKPTRPSPPPRTAPPTHTATARQPRTRSQARFVPEPPASQGFRQPSEKHPQHTIQLVTEAPRQLPQQARVTPPRGLGAAAGSTTQPVVAMPTRPPTPAPARLPTPKPQVTPPDRLATNPPTLAPVQIAPAPRESRPPAPANDRPGVVASAAPNIIPRPLTPGLPVGRPAPTPQLAQQVAPQQPALPQTITSRTAPQQPVVSNAGPRPLPTLPTLPTPRFAAPPPRPQRLPSPTPATEQATSEQESIAAQHRRWWQTDGETAPPARRQWVSNALAETAAPPEEPVLNGDDSQGYASRRRWFQAKQGSLFSRAADAPSAGSSRFPQLPSAHPDDPVNFDAQAPRQPVADADFESRRRWWNDPTENGRRLLVGRRVHGQPSNQPNAEPVAAIAAATPKPTPQRIETASRRVPGRYQYRTGIEPAGEQLAQPSTPSPQTDALDAWAREASSYAMTSPRGSAVEASPSAGRIELSSNETESPNDNHRRWWMRSEQRPTFSEQIGRSVRETGEPTLAAVEGESDEVVPASALLPSEQPRNGYEARRQWLFNSAEPMTYIDSMIGSFSTMLTSRRSYVSQPEPGTAAPGYQQLSGADSIGDEPRDTSLNFLRGDTVLLAPGEWQTDVGFTYSVTEDIVPVAITDNAGTINEVVRGRIRQRLMLMPLQFRHGFSERVQTFLRIPLGWSNNEFAVPGLDEYANNVGIGDISGGASILLSKSCEERQADIIGTVGFTLPTGNDSFPILGLVPDSQLGEGFFALSMNLLFLHTYDPLVLFYGAGYRHRFTDTSQGNKINPGEQFLYQFGVGFAINQWITLSSSFLGQVITDNYVNNQRLEGSLLEPMRLRFSATINDTMRVPHFRRMHEEDVIIEPFAEIGMTDDAPSARFGIIWTR